MHIDTGSQFAGYTVVKLLGRGGMGTVHLVREPGIDRLVALKVLPEQLVNDAKFAARLEHEARIIGGLDHPNIVPLYRYGITDDVPWMALRYVDGGELAERMKEGPLPLPEGLSLLRGVASALDYAHSKGVIHRDLKPQNILLSGGGAAYLADFGVAKLLEGTVNTATGNVIGTPSYMAPEQAKGEKLGSYTDVYALAVICFQWLTGSLPFEADTPYAVLMKHVLEPVPPGPLAQLAPSVAAVLEKGLAKEPVDRFQSAGALISQLENALGLPSTASQQRTTVTVAGAGKRWKVAILVVLPLAIAIGGYAYWRKALHSPAELRAEQQAAADAGSAQPAGEIATPAMSIAVLPFTNVSSDKEQDYFADGIAEDVLNLLAKIPQLQVTARTSSFSFKGKQITIPEIAKVLHVANVLEGSVRKAGDAVRITTRLIRASDGYEIWSQSWDRKFEDIFAIQDGIAAEVARNLQVKLLGDVPTARQTDPKAYALYLQAVQHGRLNTAEAFQQSDALYRNVLAIDPRYAPAWAGLAENFNREANQGLLPNKEGYAQAREAATKALAIDPEYTSAHATLGHIAMYGDNDLAGAAQHFKRALAVDPADPDVLRNSALLLGNLGRLDEALALEEALVRRDPVNAPALNNLGLHQRWAGRFDAAIASFRNVLSLAPGRGGTPIQIGFVLLLKSDSQGALTEIEQETTDAWKMIGLPMAYHALGRKADSNAALAALIAKYEKACSYNIAHVYAYRGEADKAFEWLDKAVEYGDLGIADIVGENLFDNIHADPRWLPFLRKIGKAPEQLAKIEFKVTLPQMESSSAGGGAHP
ncbi:MAG: protein kinase [Rudaea sp.]|nr:protein kinase [Rudaea sp.]